MKVSPKQFIEVWQRAKSVKEVSEKTGMKVSAASARAWHYRLKGVNLKRFRGRQKADWAALKILADSLVEGGEE